MAWDSPWAWERQPGEGVRAFEAFCVYRDLPPGERSLRRAAEVLGKGVDTLKEWSRRHDWVSRVEDADWELQGRRYEARRRAVEEMGERHVRVAVSAQAKALKRLQDMSPSELSPGDVVRYLVEATKLERLARGEPERIEEERREEIDARSTNVEEAMERYAPALQALINRGAIRPPSGPSGVTGRTARSRTRTNRELSLQGVAARGSGRR